MKFIPTEHTGLVQTFKKYERMVKPGICFYIPFIQDIKFVSNKVINTKYSIYTKTKDSAFITIKVGLQSYIKPDNSAVAWYTLSNPNAQFDACLRDAIRSKISQITLDECFVSREEISVTVKSIVMNKMSKYGYKSR